MTGTRAGSSWLAASKRAATNPPRPREFARILCGVGVAVGAVNLVWVARGQSITPVPNTSVSYPSALSGDGSVIIGIGVIENQNRACRWSSQTGLQVLDTLPGLPGSSAEGVNADGSVVVGYCYLPGSNFGQHAVRWNANGTVQDLGLFSSGRFSKATWVSGDGSVVVGISEVFGTTNHAFRWTAGTGLQDLGIGAAVAYGVSADGNSIVGGMGFGAGVAFRWTEAMGVRSLGVLPGASSSYAMAANADGSVVIGMSTLSTGIPSAFRWSAETGMQNLGAPAGMVNAQVRRISSDGSVVVGYCPTLTGSDYRAFIWTSLSEMTTLNDYLAARGVDMSQWTLRFAFGLSSDGQTILGSGYQGTAWRNWIVHLDTPCVANCDGSSVGPALNILDFMCFLNAFASGESRANCDGSTTEPVLNVQDFVCFLSHFAAGCP